jgi:hypothetical protein
MKFLSSSFIRMVLRRNKKKLDTSVRETTDVITDYDINDTPFKLEGNYFTKYREDFKNAVNEEIEKLLRTILHIEGEETYI